MTPIDRLKDQGVKLRRTSQGDQKTVCPKCGGGRSKEHSLSVTIAADHVVWKCHRGTCGWSGAFFERDEDDPTYGRSYRKRESEPATPKPLPNDDLPAEVVSWFAKRCISAQTLKAYSVKFGSAWMPGDEGTTSATVQFPYFDIDGISHVNTKYRTLDKRFRQEKGAKKVFFGLQHAVGKKALIIVEGEIDAMSLYEAGLSGEYGILSVPDGAPSQYRWDDGRRECQVHKKITDPSVLVCPGCGARRILEIDPQNDKKFEYLANCEVLLNEAEKIVLAVDADGPGRILEEELSRRIGAEKCWRVTWPATDGAGVKDANECLEREGPIILQEVIAEAIPSPLKSLFEARSYEDETIRLYLEGRTRGVSTGFPSLDPLLTIVPGQFSAVTGYPGSGKSEFIDALAVNLAENHGWRFAVCSFENPPAEHIAKLAEKHTRLPFWDGPRQKMGLGDLKDAIKWVNHHFVFIRAEEETPTIDWVIAQAKAACLRYGINGLIIDPYNEFEHVRTAGKSETEYVSESLGKIKRLAQSRSLHVWFIAHPAKPQKEYETKPPSLYDISGSSHWVNKADIGLVVHRGTDDQGARSRSTEIIIRKVRFKSVGEPGSATLGFNPANGRYIDDKDKSNPDHPDNNHDW